jgi:transposase-like protein
VKPERVEEWKRAVFETIELMSKEDAFGASCLQQDMQDNQPRRMKYRNNMIEQDHRFIKKKARASN